MLFSVNSVKQKDLVLFNFQENKRILEKSLYRLFVDVVGSTYAAELALNFPFVEILDDFVPPEGDPQRIHDIESYQKMGYASIFNFS